MALPHEKQGYLDNLSSKSVTELKELLARQENLIKKQKFLASLPDKGEKVHRFRDHLMQLISCKQQVIENNKQKCKEILSNKGEQSVKLENSVNGEPSSRKESRFVRERKERRNEEQSERLTTPPGLAGTLAERLADNVQEVDIVLEVGVNNQTVDKLKDVKNRDFSTLRDKSAHQQTCGIEDSLQRLDIEDDKDLVDNTGDATTLSSYEVKNIQKFNEQSTLLGAKFKPNSSTKNKMPTNQLVECKPQSSILGETQSMETHRRTRDLALEGPEYIFNQSKLISLEDSIHLQREQKKITEEMQAKHAAERLAERLNIAMETYNPEGTDMSYRQNEPEIDSDDDIDYPE